MDALKRESTKGFLESTARCPDCRSQGLVFGETMIFCGWCQARFPVIDGKPALMRHDNQLFSLSSYVSPARAARKEHPLSRWVCSPSVNVGFKRSLLKLKEALRQFDRSYVLVVGSGKQRARLEHFFPPSDKITLVCCDVDRKAVVDLFCDAHELPFADGVFHAVIATAVLQHVMYPDRVVKEMFRILVAGGVVYSEVAFMQQVCEGAYDFNRYTLSGHRLLFRDFRELSTGIVGGPGTALVWAVENFVLCFARNKKLRSALKAVVRLLFFWVPYFDYFLKNRPAAIDAASCTYFLGTKDAQGGTSEAMIVSSYVGEKHLRHT